MISNLILKMRLELLSRELVEQIWQQIAKFISLWFSESETSCCFKST